MVWSVNSDGPNFRAILTGAVGDYGPGVSVYPDGAVDPDHGSELKLSLSHGTFRLSIEKLDSEFGHAVVRWPYDRATCSIHRHGHRDGPNRRGVGNRRLSGHRRRVHADH